jgi:hypothetical protein
LWKSVLIYQVNQNKKKEPEDKKLDKVFSVITKDSKRYFSITSKITLVFLKNTYNKRAKEGEKTKFSTKDRNLKELLGKNYEQINLNIKLKLEDILLREELKTFVSDIIFKYKIRDIYTKFFQDYFEIKIINGKMSDSQVLELFKKENERAAVIKTFINKFKDDFSTINEKLLKYFTKKCGDRVDELIKSINEQRKSKGFVRIERKIALYLQSILEKKDDYGESNLKTAIYNELNRIPTPPVSPVYPSNAINLSEINSIPTDPFLLNAPNPRNNLPPVSTSDIPDNMSLTPTEILNYNPMVASNSRNNLRPVSTSDIPDNMSLADIEPINSSMVSEGKKDDDNDSLYKLLMESQKDDEVLSKGPYLPL